MVENSPVFPYSDFEQVEYPMPINVSTEAHVYKDEEPFLFIITDKIMNVSSKILARINFQKGPIKENGVNGVTNEDLLAVVRHRLRYFQSGPFACRENEMALEAVDNAINWLGRRTLDRVKRGVEGENKV